MKYIFIFLLTHLSLIHSSHALTSDAPATKDQALFQYSWQRMGSALAAPLHRSARTSLISGSLLTGLLIITRKDTVDPLQASVTTRKPLGPDWAEFGDLMGQTVPNILYAGALGLHGFFLDEQKSYSRSLFMIESTLFSGFTTNVLKSLAQEERPNGGDKRSFPSGHTTSAFAFAAVVALEHAWYYSVPAFALASLVGFSRIDANAHYLHDVVFGATVGITYALGLNQFYNAKKLAQHKLSPTSYSPRWAGIHLQQLKNSSIPMPTILWVF